MNTKGKIMRKLLGQPTATAGENNDTTNLDSPQLRPSASQNTIYSAGVPIACLDRSPDGQRAVIAGPKVFKILKVDGSTITEDIDLRAVISSYASTHDLSAATSDQLNIRAVEWSHGTLDTTIVTACGNGRITIYDLNRAGEGLEVGRIQEHARQVHKLAISPFKNFWLLSASQDGTVKTFDVRAPVQGRNGPPFRTLQTFKCNADAVRDVKWSPTDGYEFACCTDAGVVQKWDVRKPSAPVLRLTAHPSSCFSISWHPDGEHLVSGGMDQFCHVWDVSKKADRNQKPRYSFATPAPVSKVSWRPACWSATAQGRRAAQVTVAYDESNASRNQASTVHLWDLARPAMPFKEIEQWDHAPTGLLWNSRDLLWSVDKEGHFIQTDVAFVPKLIDRRSLSDFAFSSTSDILMLLEERQSVRRPRPITSPEVSPSFQHSGNGPVLSVSRSDSEEDVVGSFLGPRQRKGGHRRRNSRRSTQPLSTTPPNITSMTENKVMSLDDAVMVTGTYKPQQVLAIGHVPSTSTRRTYKYFANQYLLRIAHSTEEQPPNIRITSTMDSFARAAENVGQYRLAQTWRLLGYTMNLLLTRRAEHHRQSRLTTQLPIVKENGLKEVKLESNINAELNDDTPRKFPRARTPLDSSISRTARSLVIEDIESTSNVATPLVRPVRDTIAHHTREAIHTSIMGEGDEFKLPDAAHPNTPSPIPVPGARQSPTQSASSVEGYDFYGMESFDPKFEFTAPIRKQPLRLQYPELNNSSRIQPQRHDSGESFQMFSTSGDSQHSKYMKSSDSDSQSESKDNGPSLRERFASWENSLPSHPRHRPSIDSDVPIASGSESFVGPDSHSEIRFQNGPSLSSYSPPVFPVQRKSEPSSAAIAVARVAIQDDSTSPTADKKASKDPNLIESDFLPWSNDPDFLIQPIDPTILVQRSISYEVQSGSANAAAMVLLLRPLLPPDAIDEIQAGAILRQYHQRLTSLKLFTEAALLRNLCVPVYPSVFASAQENIKIGYFCTDCHKPIENDPSVPESMWKCPRCRKYMDSCAVCKGRNIQGDLEYESEDLQFETVLWWLCPGCGHGGHGICMQAWHAGPEFKEGDKYSGGCCPLEGCLHACLPGSWREQKMQEAKIAKAKELSMLVKENSRQGNGRGGSGRAGSVRRDAREVNQSKAVEGVRVALGVSNLSSSGAGAGLERKRSVKLVAPREGS